MITSQALDPRLKIFVAGHKGLLGSALVRQLEALGSHKILVVDRKSLDLRDSEATRKYFKEARPDIVVSCAALVGGIKANMERPADFLKENLAIQSSLFNAALENGTNTLVHMGSSCVYPKGCPQPMAPHLIGTGKVEQTNLGYATAKLTGIAQCEVYSSQYGVNYFTVIPASIYGPGDNFDAESSHVMSAMIRKFVQAKKTGGSVLLWGTGKPRREFIFVDDAARAIIFLLANYRGPGPINVGPGTDVEIRELAGLIANTSGFKGTVSFDSSMPDGVFQKLLDSREITELGFQPRVGLESGIHETIAWFEKAFASEL